MAAGRACRGEEEAGTRERRRLFAFPGPLPGTLLPDP